MQLSREEYARKRICIGCLVRIENSVTRHVSWCRKSYLRDGIFNPNLTTIKDSYSLERGCCYGLVGGRPYWWSEEYAQHILLVLEAEEQVWWSVTTLALKSPRRMSLPLRDVAEMSLSQASYNCFDFICVGHRRRIGTDDGCMFISR